MNIRSLRVFVNVMEEGTLARASSNLNLSQPAASRLIHILEQEYGTLLFFRDKKRLTPTPEGEFFYPEALRILASVDEIPSFFEQIKNNAVIPLRVICHPRLANGLVLPAMALLSEREPILQTKLEIHPRRDLGRRIMHDLYDIGVTTLPLPVDTLEPHILGTTDLHVVLPNRHHLSKKKSLSPVDVASIPYVALDENTVIRRMVDKELAVAGATLKIAHEVSAGAAAYRMVKAGMGFSFADPVALDPELTGDLTLVPWRPRTNVEFGYFVPSVSRVHPSVKSFVDCLDQVLVKRLQ